MWEYVEMNLENAVLAKGIVIVFIGIDKNHCKKDFSETVEV